MINESDLKFSRKIDNIITSPVHLAAWQRMFQTHQVPPELDPGLLAAIVRFPGWRGWFRVRTASKTLRRASLLLALPLEVLVGHPAPAPAPAPASAPALAPA